MQPNQVLTALRILAQGDKELESALETFRTASLRPEQAIELVTAEMRDDERHAVGDALVTVRTATLLAAMRVRGEAPQEDVGEDVGDDDNGERPTERIVAPWSPGGESNLGDDGRIDPPWSPGGESNL
jgi:hypothetical protein